MKIFAQKLLVGRTFLANQTVTVEDGQITAIGGGGPADFYVWALTPGLVDLHCHGGQGFDPELNERPLPEFLTILLCHGVTDVLLTLGAEPLPTMRRALAVVQTAMQQQAAGKLPGAHILGVHLEGPFLSPERPGAMPPAALLPPTLAAYQTLVQGYESVIRQVTLAPELPGALELGAALAARGVRVQAGHTDADYETAQRAFSAGFTGLCHTFNACRPLRHRDPGVVAAALLDPNVTTECICDLVHLHPAALQLVYHMKGPEAMIAVSDSVATHGLPDGHYTVAGQDYIVQNDIHVVINQWWPAESLSGIKELCIVIKCLHMSLFRPSEFENIHWRGWGILIRLLGKNIYNWHANAKACRSVEHFFPFIHKYVFLADTFRKEYLEHRGDAHWNFATTLCPLMISFLSRIWPRKKISCFLWAGCMMDIRKYLRF